MAKHFVVNPNVESVGKEAATAAAARDQKILKDSELLSRERNAKQLAEYDDLVHVEGRVIIKVDMDYKNSHTFADGTVIRREREFNEFNRNITQPVNAVVISGEDMLKGSEILIHQNGAQDSYRIFDYNDENEKVKYYSIAHEHCFAWHDGKRWLPLPPYDFALRVFKPYVGVLQDIEPTQLKDTLFVTTGELAGNVVKTLIACDYQIIFNDKDGREGNLIRFRPFGCKRSQREEEALAILGDETEKVLSGEYLVGITISDAKPYEISAYAD